MLFEWGKQNMRSRLNGAFISSMDKNNGHVEFLPVEIGGTESFILLRK